MGEIIKRALTPTVGQNSLAAWLESPELANPIRNQSTELQPCQELLPFQIRRRYQSLTVGLSGVDTTAFFSAVVPETEAWFIELLTIAHDSAAGDRTFELEVSLPGIMQLPQKVARIVVPAGFTLDLNAMPLVGGALYQVAGNERFNQPGGFAVGPKSVFNLQNLSAMIAGETVNFRIRYRLIPLPLEEQLASIWNGIGGT